MAKYALIEDGLVINTIEYDTEAEKPAPYKLPAGRTMVAATEDVAIGFVYTDGEFVDPHAEEE